MKTGNDGGELRWEMKIELKVESEDVKREQKVRVESEDWN